MPKLGILSDLKFGAAKEAAIKSRALLEWQQSLAIFCHCLTVPERRNEPNFTVGLGFRRKSLRFGPDGV
jgi:hypothetical protein